MNPNTEPAPEWSVKAAQEIATRGHPFDAESKTQFFARIIADHAPKDRTTTEAINSTGKTLIFGPVDAPKETGGVTEPTITVTRQQLIDTTRVMSGGVTSMMIGTRHAEKIEKLAGDVFDGILAVPFPSASPPTPLPSDEDLAREIEAARNGYHGADMNTDDLAALIAKHTAQYQQRIDDLQLSLLKTIQEGNDVRDSLRARVEALEKEMGSINEMCEMQDGGGTVAQCIGKKIERLYAELHASQERVKELTQAIDDQTKGVWSQWWLDRAKIVGELESLNLFKVPELEGSLTAARAKIAALETSIAEKIQRIRDKLGLVVGQPLEESCVAMRAHIASLESERDNWRGAGEMDKQRIADVGHNAVHYVGAANYRERQEEAHEMIDAAMRATGEGTKL